MAVFMSKLRAENPRKTSCEVCRSLKRKCNGTFRMCKKKKKRETVEVISQRHHHDHQNAKPLTRRSGSPLQQVLMAEMDALAGSATFVRQSLDPLVSFLDKMGVCFALNDETITLPSTTMVEICGLPEELAALFKVTELDEPVDHGVLQKYLSRRRKGTMLIEIVHPKFEKDGTSTFFRYSMCCMAAIMSNPPAPHIIGKTYYKMAKKLIPSAMDNPNIETLQAMLMLYSCGIVATVYYGQPSFFQNPPAQPYADPIKLPSRNSLIELTNVAHRIASTIQTPIKTPKDLLDHMPEVRLTEGHLLEWYENQADAIRVGMGIEDAMAGLCEETPMTSGGGVPVEKVDEISMSEQAVAEMLLSSFLYHTCWCLLHRPRLCVRLSEEGVTGVDATARDLVRRSMKVVERSATAIHGLVERIMARRNAQIGCIHPSVGFSVITSFYGFRDLILRPETGAVKRQRYLGMMKTNFEMIKRFNDVWESFGAWTPVVKKDLERVVDMEF
ncbi:hypothetical protein HDU67_004657 [Dinochytrium kinnereticum]|nr:hypothetical protein HDU67_004657 [Dinochytrium kinnereticum]